MEQKGSTPLVIIIHHRMGFGWAMPPGRPGSDRDVGGSRQKGQTGTALGHVSTLDVGLGGDFPEVGKSKGFDQKQNGYLQLFPSRYREVNPRIELFHTSEIPGEIGFIALWRPSWANFVARVQHGWPSNSSWDAVEHKKT